jgi:hypothetical protein
MRDELQPFQSVPYLSGACTSDAGLTCLTGAECELASASARTRWGDFIGMAGRASGGAEASNPRFAGPQWQ